jgi:hypothetical protein
MAAITRALIRNPAASAPPAWDNREPTAIAVRRLAVRRVPVDLVPDIMCFLPIRCVDVFRWRSPGPLFTRHIDPALL